MLHEDSSNGRALLDLIDARTGHLRFASGHHGDVWLELASLSRHPAPRAVDTRLPLACLARLPTGRWRPTACPLGARGLPLQDGSATPA
jgi:hypothetical protein